MARESKRDQSFAFWLKCAYNVSPVCTVAAAIRNVVGV